MERYHSEYPKDPKEARKVFIGYVVLVAEKLGFDNHEDRKKAVLLAKSYLNGEVNEARMKEEHDRLAKLMDDPELWENRNSEIFYNVSLGVTLSDLEPWEEYAMDCWFDGLLINMEKLGFKTDAEYALRKDYFAKYKPKT